MCGARLANAMSLAASSRGRPDWVAALLSAPQLRGAWGIPDHDDRVALEVFLSSAVFEPPSQTEWIALQVLDVTPIECLRVPKSMSPLRTALRLGQDNLVAELIRRNVYDIDQFPTYVSRDLLNTDSPKWMDIFHANRSYFNDILPALKIALENIVPAPHTLPEPLLHIIAQFVRGPFQL
jgi:hypothetical protein